MLARLSIFAAILCASTQVLGATNGWTAIGPNGGAVNKIVFNKATPSTVYAIASGGFYRSQDGGVSWQLIKSDFFNAPQDLAIDPSDSNRVYLIAPNYPCLYVSTDGGASMSAVMTLPTAVTSAWQIAVSQSGTTLYVTSGMRVFFSTDRASTWQERTAVGTYASARVLKLSIDPTDPNTLYASATTSATDAGIFATHDGAMTWQLLESGNESTSLPTDFAINAANSNQVWSARYDGVWVSNNKGITWSNVLTGPASTAIAIDPSNPAILYAGTPYGSIYRTADAGTTWIDVADKISAGQLATLAVNPALTSQLLAGGLGGVSGTTTSGTQWAAQNSGLNSSAVLGLSADSAADRIYMNVSSGGVYYSAAGAAATLPVNNVGSGGLLQLSGQSTLFVTAVLAQPGRLSASLSNGLARSSDGGSTWSLVPVTPPGTSQQVFSFASSPSAPQTILAAPATSLYRTVDGGDLWVPATTGLPANADIGKLAAAPSDPTIFYASVYTTAAMGGPTTNFGVYKSADAGLSWAPANTGIGSSGISALAVNPADAKVVYVSTATALLRTMDGGATWSPLTWDTNASGDIPFVAAFDPLHSGILYAASGARIARSVDGGTSWQELRAASTLPNWSPTALIADPNRPENILAATNGSGTQQFTIAPDLSLSVTAPPSPVAVGTAATYNYTMSNRGPFDATGVRVSVQLPATAQTISATASGGVCTVASGVAACTFEIARVGVNYAIAVSAISPATGPFQLTASVVADQPDPNSSNNAVTTTQNVANVADLSVTLTGTPSATVGGAVSFTAVVKNAGPNNAAGTQLLCQLAPGLTLGTTTAVGATCTSSASGLVICSAGDLAAAKSATVTINATAAVVGAQTSTVTATSTATDMVASNNSAATTTTVAAVPTAAAPSKGGGGSLSIGYLLMLAALLAMQERALKSAA
jgi:uncharacterized repeat protein (TIGR01451 family)